MVAFRKKTIPNEVPLSLDWSDIRGPVDHPGLPVVQVGRFISPYSQSSDQNDQMVVLMLSADLSVRSANTGTVDLTAIDGVSKTTAELIRLAEAHIAVGPDTLYPMMNFLAHVGILTAGIETITFGLNHRGYEMHFFAAMDMFADGFSMTSTGYTSLGRFSAAANYCTARAAQSFGPEAAREVHEQALQIARDSLESLLSLET